MDLNRLADLREGSINDAGGNPINMAKYIEGGLMVVAMEKINGETPSPEDVVYARKIMNNPNGEALKWVKAFLGLFHAQTEPQVAAAVQVKDTVLQQIRAKWALFLE